MGHARTKALAAFSAAVQEGNLAPSPVFHRLIWMLGLPPSDLPATAFYAVIEQATHNCLELFAKCLEGLSITSLSPSSQLSSVDSSAAQLEWNVDTLKGDTVDFPGITSYHWSCMQTI